MSPGSVIDAERLINIAMSCRAAIQQRSAGNRGRTARHFPPFERVGRERASGDHRQPALDPTEVHAFLIIHRYNSHVVPPLGGPEGPPLRLLNVRLYVC